MSSNSISGNDSYGQRALKAAVIFLFSSDESEKERGRANLKMALELLAEPGYRKYSPEACENNPQPLKNIKEVISTIINSAPVLISEKIRIAAEIKAQKDKERAVREQEEARIQAERDAEMLAEQKVNEALEQRVETCRATNEYKVYRAAASILYNNALAARAKLEMQHQEEGARISGYVDKGVMYKNGNIIAEVARVNVVLFDTYIRVGGSAKNIEAIRASSDPCDINVIKATVSKPAKPSVTLQPTMTNIIGKSQASQQSHTSPSFDCAKASTNAENLICSNTDLAEADAGMSRTYKAAIANHPDQTDSIRSAQNRWRKDVRDKCVDVNCMLGAYRSRGVELTN